MTPAQILQAISPSISGFFILILELRTLGDSAFLMHSASCLFCKTETKYFFLFTAVSDLGMTCSRFILSPTDQTHQNQQDPIRHGEHQRISAESVRFSLLDIPVQFILFDHQPDDIDQQIG